MSSFDELCRILRDECGAETAERVTRRLRDMFGAQRIYVPSKPSPDVDHTDTVETLRKRHGVSRTTAYNWLNRYRL